MHALERVACSCSGLLRLLADTADQLLKGDPDVKVDIYERLPVPYGLVRYGVAPDHQEVKNVTLRFEQIASDPRCTLLANVSVGERGSTASTAVSASVPLATLREQYHAVVLAYGADSDRTLGLPGEDLSGVHSARQFVEWYNGHPLAAAEGFSLRSCETAVVIGHGNVALDCARVLSSTPEQLVGETDIAARAAAELAESNVRQVVLLGRRGVQHAAFTIKELRELSKRAGSSTRAQRGGPRSRAAMSLPHPGISPWGLDSHHARSQPLCRILPLRLTQRSRVRGLSPRRSPCTSRRVCCDGDGGGCKGAATQAPHGADAEDACER